MRTMADASVPEGQASFDAWHALDRRSQERIRRLVRIGRPVDASEAALAIAYARFQSRRPWQRFFWVWFVPGVVVAVGAALRVHPLVVGVAIGFAGQAVLAHVDLGRAGQINRAALRSTR